MSGSNTQVAVPEWQSDLLTRHQLDASYLDGARKWFIPLAQSIALHQKSAGRPVLVGLNGSQGSGKTTVSDFLRCALTEDFDQPTVALSLDDVYLPHQQRQQLARDVHPLLATRGVPGTHDIPLLLNTLESLLDPVAAPGTALPCFDKASDDRVDLDRWPQVATPPTVVLLEGWCLGAQPQTVEELASPMNRLEREEDPDGCWRRYVNDCLARDFPPVYARIDQWIMLQAPSFDCVYQWRREQEQKLAARQGGMTDRMMDDAALERFVAHFERLTRHCLATLPDRVDHLLLLDETRAVLDYRPGEGGAR